MGVMESGALFVGENPHFFIPVMLLGWAKRALSSFLRKRKKNILKRKKKRCPYGRTYRDCPGLSTRSLSAVLVWESPSSLGHEACCSDFPQTLHHPAMSWDNAQEIACEVVHSPDQFQCIFN